MCPFLHVSLAGLLLLPILPYSESSFSGSYAAIRTIFVNSFDAVYCQFSTCCNDRWIFRNVEGLDRDLSENLHGQHLVKKAVVGHIKGHLRSRDPPKALVLSFHGPTGVGKNFVSRIIADNLYKHGLRSPFVHLLSATKEFPHEGMIPFYKEQLQSWIQGNVSRCERSMFIFDEVDKLPASLLDVVKPYMDYYEELAGVDYRKAIFLFLSNTGGRDVGEVVYEHKRAGKVREELQLSELENKVMLAAINADNHNGLWHSKLISDHLITAFIPFLPLEKQHVRLCIKDALVAKKYRVDDHDLDRISDLVIKELTFYPASEQYFSATGCKRVSEKIDYILIDEPPPGSKRIEL